MSEIEKAKFKLSILRHTINCENFTKYKMLFDDKELSGALDASIQALQEKLERENPQEDCKYCYGKSYHDRELIPLYQSHDFAEIVIDSDNALYISNEDIDLSINTAEISYCPMCGRKLTKHIGEATNMKGE